MFEAGPASSSERAAVVPRGHRLRCTASLPIDQLLLPVIRSGVKGVVWLVAPEGGGKTTAIAHLRAVLPPDAAVAFFEVGQITAAYIAAQSGLVVLASVDSPSGVEDVEVLRLSKWSTDDCLEYLAAKHRPLCASVLSRLSNDRSLSTLQGSPQLMTVVLDAMATDESLIGARDILRNHLQQFFPPGSELDRLVIDGPAFGRPTNQQGRWWRHPAVQNICVADWITYRLRCDEIPHQLQSMDQAGPLIPDIAAALRLFPAVIDSLRQRVESDRRGVCTPVLASILLAVDPDWRPSDGRGMYLVKAQLAGAKWAGVALATSLLMDANFAGADLSGGNLSALNADSADFTGANIKGSVLRKSRFVGAKLDRANLSDCEAHGADFSDATLVSANLHNAHCAEANFLNADLSQVIALRADFSGASLPGANFYQADFAAANFCHVRMNDNDLSEANWSGISFAGAVLLRCNFEWLELPSADFDSATLVGCLFTGSTMPGANFRHANLSNTGLAEVNWQNADLTGADLTHASFHMGSSRSGLVGSTIAGEGSRTGFYTDDFKDRAYKEAEEIRKANLCGADLTGTIVYRTDFYLVDLRRAVYSKAQAEHFAKCGAIVSGESA